VEVDEGADVRRTGTLPLTIVRGRRDDDVARVKIAVRESDRDVIGEAPVEWIVEFHVGERAQVKRGEPVVEVLDGYEGACLWRAGEGDVGEGSAGYAACRAAYQ